MLGSNAGAREIPRENTAHRTLLVFTAILVGCGAEEEKRTSPSIVEVVEVDAPDGDSALLQECTKIVGRCDKAGVDRVVVIPLLAPKRLKVFLCESLTRARAEGCHQAPAGVGLEETAYVQQPYSDSGYPNFTPGGLDAPPYNPIGPGSGTGWEGGWRNDPQYSAYFNTPDPNLNKMREIASKQAEDRIRKENRRRALPGYPGDYTITVDPSIYHYGPFRIDHKPQPLKRPWYHPDLTSAKEDTKTLWYKFEKAMAIPGPGQSTQNASCQLACEDGIALTCEQVRNICSNMDSIGFNFAGKSVVITCLALRPLACVVAPVFGGTLCQATLCAGI